MTGLRISALAACGFMFLWVFSLGMTGFVKGRRLRIRGENIFHAMAEKGRSLAWHEKTEKWLLRNGARYHFGIKVGPMAFLVVRILLAVIGFAVLTMMAPAYGVLAAVILYALPYLLVIYMNRSDNVRMLPDLKLMYHSLEIQARAGVYVTDAMAELYGSVQEPRLKQALLDLAGDLVMRADLGEALLKFQEKFDNRYVDSLCVILLQAMESGQSVDLLSDLSEQIKDMESAVLSQKKDALDRSVTFHQLGILVAVMGLILYACVTQMFTAATSF